MSLCCGNGSQVKALLLLMLSLSPMGEANAINTLFSENNKSSSHLNINIYKLQSAHNSCLLTM